MSKKLLVVSLLLNYMVSYSQNTVSAASAATYQEDRWNLNKYVWSHTNYKTGKNNKPPLDFDAIEKWPGLGDYVSISGDGKYFSYTIDKGVGLPAYKKRDSLIIQSTENSWRYAFASTAEPGFFSSDSKLYIFQEKKKLFFYKLGSNINPFIREISSYQLPGNNKNKWLAYQLQDGSTVILQNLLNGKEVRFNNVSSFNFDGGNDWLACKLANKSKDLLLHNLYSGKELRFSFVEDFLFDKTGAALVIKRIKDPNNNNLTSLEYTWLPTGKTTHIWAQTESTFKLSNYTIDGSGKKVVFVCKGNLGALASSGNKDISDPDVSIWYWHEGMESSMLLLNNCKLTHEDNLKIDEQISFTENSKYIEFYTYPTLDTAQAMADAVNVDIWSYKDTLLQSTQLVSSKEVTKYRTLIDPVRNVIFPLENEVEKLVLLKGDYAIVSRSEAMVNGDRFWEKNYGQRTTWIVSLVNGEKQILPVRGMSLHIWFSANNQYLVFFDGHGGGNYYSYNLHTKEIINMSANVPHGQLFYRTPFFQHKMSEPCGVAGWIDDGTILVYDNWDIWQLHLDGQKPAINLTNGYGRANGIMLCLLESDRRLPTCDVILRKNASILLRGFNDNNKYSGYFRQTLAMASNPRQLFMGPCFIIKELSNLATIDHGMNPLKAANANVWILRKQSDIEPPNYYVTVDFVNYKSLTALNPQKAYNWLNTALHSFRQINNTISNGILFRPENFDSTKKYPVIISIYRHLTNRLYQFHKPEFIIAPIIGETAWMVSHGYLIFMPDIYFLKAPPGPSALNTLEGAVQYLKSLPYIDGNRIGLVGHSNSGGLGYYALTHSNSFSAICTGGAVADKISYGLSASGEGMGRFPLKDSEIDFFNNSLGHLWTNKESWLDHSSPFRSDFVNTPVLIFHNKRDAVPLEQPKEMFLSLYRLEKKAWWLYYEDGGHVLFRTRDLKDFTIRYTQFFDHYLKGAPAPMWMTKGIAARLKGIQSAYDLDREGVCGKECEFCEEIKD